MRSRVKHPIASGGLGQEIIRQAVLAGHHVTAVVRDPDKLARDLPGLAVITADVMNPTAIAPTASRASSGR